MIPRGRNRELTRAEELACESSGLSPDVLLSLKQSIDGATKLLKSKRAVRSGADMGKLKQELLTAVELYKSIMSQSKRRVAATALGAVFAATTKPAESEKAMELTAEQIAACNRINLDLAEYKKALNNAETRMLTPEDVLVARRFNVDLAEFARTKQEVGWANDAQKGR